LPLVAERIGHCRYVPLGYSRKFWYDDSLSEPVSSITSPGAEKRLRLDPNLLPLLEDRRIVVVDDAISTGATAIAAIYLFFSVSAQGLQGSRWP
jgi:adenine/guanine phosphoribosyltransferase-like PRPP-binding protein